MLGKDPTVSVKEVTSHRFNEIFNEHDQCGKAGQVR